MTVRRPVAALCAALPLALATPASAAPKDPGWFGVIQQGVGAFIDDTAYYPKAIAAAQSLGSGMERIGVDTPLSIVGGQGINWATVDGPVNAEIAAGIEVRMVLSFWFNVAHGANWNANWQYFVRQAAEHYKGRVRYYIIENEPDNAGLMPGMTAQQAYDFTCGAYSIIKSVDATARVESPPTTSPTAPFLQTMLNLGVTRCADVVGIHSYGSQLTDTHAQSISKVWDLERAAHASYGVPILPVANSEAGNSYSWAPAATVDKRAWEARWHWLAHVQHKAWGYDSLQIFAMRSPSGLWDVAGWNGSSVVPNPLVWNAISAGYTRRGMANGDFEATSDPDGWTPVYDIGAAGTPPELAAVSFPQGDAANAHGGGGYLREAGAAQVRRVVENLTPGVPVTVTAWANTSGTGARVRLMGWDGYAGPGDVAAAVPAGSGWRQVSLAVTPKRTWVVIGLENGGSAPALWDDVAASQGAAPPAPPAPQPPPAVDLAALRADLDAAQARLDAMRTRLDAAAASP